MPNKLDPTQKAHYGIGLNGTSRTLVTIGCAFGGTIILLVASTCSRVVDNETQIKVNTGELIRMESDIKERALITNVVEIAADVKILEGRLDREIAETLRRHDESVAKIAEIREKLDIHLDEDKRNQEDLQRQLKGDQKNPHF